MATRGSSTRLSALTSVEANIEAEISRNGRDAIALETVARHLSLEPTVSPVNWSVVQTEDTPLTDAPRGQPRVRESVTISGGPRHEPSS